MINSIAGIALTLSVFHFPPLSIPNEIEAQNMAGAWVGQFRSSGPNGMMELRLSSDATQWKAEARFTGEGREFSNPIHDLKINDTGITFTTELGGADVRLIGKLSGKELGGILEAFQDGSRVGTGTWSLTWRGSIQAVAPIAMLQADPNFDPQVRRPAYAQKSPKVLFDEAHHNHHTTAGRYKPFVDLITNDGYQVTPNKKGFSKNALQGHDILVIANAMAPEVWSAGSAFTKQECDAVHDWVNGGGSLLLIADHTPFGDAAENLAKRFAVDMSKGYTFDPRHTDGKNDGNLLFSRENKLLADHAITRGRRANEQINRVVSFTGQSLKGPEGSVALFKLASTAYDELAPDRKRVSAAGRVQGLAFQFGKGRVIILGEAGMLSAQKRGTRCCMGMNEPGNDNRQLVLNIMHWLSRLL
jgi:hypothetical protein